LITLDIKSRITFFTPLFYLRSITVAFFFSSSFFIFISIIQVIDVGGKTLSRGTDRGMAYAKFKAHKFSLLNITNIGSDYVLKGSECGLACINIPSCFSFNLAAFSDINNGKILCELLPSDIYNNSKNFVASQLYHHYSITVSENSSANFRHDTYGSQLKLVLKEKKKNKRKTKKQKRREKIRILLRTWNTFLYIQSARKLMSPSKKFSCCLTCIV